MNNSIIFLEQDRDIDGYYLVNPSLVHSHQIGVVDDVTALNLQIIHYYQNSQDLSLRLWFSEYPANIPVLNLDKDGFISLSRVGFQYSLSSIESQLNTTFKIQKNKNYYVNIRNLTNAPNGYRLIFS
jgi:hypothetical protein